MLGELARAWSELSRLIPDNIEAAIIIAFAVVAAAMIVAGVAALLGAVKRGW